MAQEIKREAQSVGEILRQSRVHYGLEIADVESALRIRALHLQALEDGRTDRLPGRVYAIGFVRAYAEYLGLDGAQMVELFKTQAAGPARKPEYHLPVAASESKIPNVWIFLGAFIALAAGLIIFSVAGEKDNGAESIPAVGEVVHIEDLDAGQAPLETAMLSAIATAVGVEGPAALIKPVSRISLRVTESAWVEIRNAENKAILSRIMKAGDSYMVPDEKGMTLSTGNAGVLSLTVDGTPVPPPGAKGEILRNVALDADVLKPPLPAADDVMPEDAFSVPEETPPPEEKIDPRAAAPSPQPSGTRRSVPLPVERPDWGRRRNSLSREGQGTDSYIVRTPRDREGM